MGASVRTMVRILSASDGGGSPGCDAHHRAMIAAMGGTKTGRLVAGSLPALVPKLAAVKLRRGMTRAGPQRRSIVSRIRLGPGER